MKDMVGGCCVCSDDQGFLDNPIVYCDGDGCNVGVHQACYGIVQVPSGPWFCRKCESQERAARVRCELCPCRDGALKKTDQNGWAHVVCALYIPEVRFFNVTTMEPIQTSLIPAERFHKTCFICEENNRGSKASFGACMQCNRQGCKQNFHVTCAQLLGLLCEEAGNMMDNVKYCGYCQYHYSKLKKTSNMKIIPPFRPIPATHPAESSSPEKGSQQRFSSSEDSKSTLNSTLTSSSAVTSNTVCDNETLGKVSVVNNISPDMNHPSNSKNIKSSKKSHSSGGKGSDSKPAVIPRISIAPSNLFASNQFMKHSSSISSAIKEAEVFVDSKTDIKAKSVAKSEENPESGTTKKDDVSSDKPLKNEVSIKESFIQKKDFSTLQLKEVVTAALDRPMTNSPGSKFDHSSGSSLVGAIESSSLAPRFSSMSEKPPPPDIKPHVTLTPIPMRTSTTRLSASREEAEERERDREREKSSKSKSPVSALNFSNSFGQSHPPKLQNQNVSPDMAEVAVCKGKNGPPDLSLQGELPSSDKTAPPAKRSRVEIDDDFGDNSEAASEAWAGREDEEVPFTRSGSRREVYAQHQAQVGRSTSPSHSSSSGIVGGRNFNQAQEMSVWESSAKQSKFGMEVELNEELKPLKRGPGRPPRRTGPSRDDDRERKPQVKSRGGRRGGTNNALPSNFSRRETRESSNAANSSMSNGTFLDDNSFDDPLDGSNTTSGSGRGGRQSALGRKSAGGRSSRTEDPPAPTLAQLRQQGGDSVGSSLPAHMFGNALNPASSMAQRMVDTLSQEIEAAAVSVPEVVSPQPQLIGIPFPGKPGGLSLPTSSSASTTTTTVLQNNSGSSSSTSNTTSTTTTVTGRSASLSSADTPSNNGLNGTQPSSGPPPTLEQLLERQWEQGSQFLMEQAQHLDIAQLLSCLNQLKQDNRALEEHIQSLSQRKDQLTAINARLSAPLGSSSTLMSAGAGFNPPNANTHNGHGQGTPPPNVQHGKAGTIVVQTPVPSPQQHHDMHIQGRMSSTQAPYSHSNELPGGNSNRNNELSIAHSTHSPHGHTIHGVHGHGNAHRSQPMSSGYGAFSSHGSAHGPIAVPVVTSHPPTHPTHHSLPRDSR